MQRAHFEINGHKENFRNGVYDIVDVSGDHSWGDVKAVESHKNSEGRFTGTVNHRDQDYNAACAALVNLGAKKW